MAVFLGASVLRQVVDLPGNFLVDRCLVRSVVHQMDSDLVVPAARVDNPAADEALEVSEVDPAAQEEVDLADSFAAIAMESTIRHLKKRI